MLAGNGSLCLSLNCIHKSGFLKLLYDCDGELKKMQQEDSEFGG